MQGSGAGFIAPLKVVEDDYHGPLPRLLANEPAEPAEEAVTAFQALISENGLFRFCRLPAQRIDPQREGTIYLGQVGAGLKQVSACIQRAPSQSFEQGALANPGFTAQHQNARFALPDDRFERIVQQGQFLFATMDRRADRKMVCAGNIRVGHRG
ncbi:MAG: hypothetical protein PVJ17_02815, partial [Lysobacterales bacterium]